MTKTVRVTTEETAAAVMGVLKRKGDQREFRLTRGQVAAVTRPAKDRRRS